VTIVSGLFAFVRRWRAASKPGPSVVILATAPLFYGASQYANMDLLVAACISATILLVAQRRSHATKAALPPGAGGGVCHGGASASSPRPDRCGAAAVVWSCGACHAPSGQGLRRCWHGHRAGLCSRRLRRRGSWPFKSDFPDFEHYFFVVQHFQRFVSTGFNNPQPWCSTRSCCCC